MNFSILSLITLILSGTCEIGLTNEVELPPNLRVCYRNVPSSERNECLKESISTVIPALKNGFPQLNIAPIDPYEHGRSNFSYDQGILKINQNLRNVVVYGISDVQIQNVRSKVNDRNIYLEFDVLFPRLEMVADYKGNAILSELTVKSGGKINITAIGVTSTYKLLGKVNKTDTNDYISIKGFDMSNTGTKQIFFDATGLFPDPDVNKFATEFINQHWRLLYDQLVPEVKKIWGPVCVKVANKFFEQVPYSQLMPKKLD